MVSLTDFSFIGTANAQAAGGNPIAGFLPFILILGVMYFLVIRPQNKKAKEHREMVAALKKGDKVVGAGGLYGTVTNLNSDHELEVEIAKDVKVTMVRSSVTAVMAKETLATKAAASDSTVTKTLKKSAKKPAAKKTAAKKTTAKKPATKTAKK